MAESATDLSAAVPASVAGTPPAPSATAAALGLAPLPSAESLPRWLLPGIVLVAFAWSLLLVTRPYELAGLSVAIVEAGYLALVIAYFRRTARLDAFGWILAGSALAAAAWFAVFRSWYIGECVRIVLVFLNLVLPAYASGAVARVWDSLVGIGAKWDVFGAFFRTLVPTCELFGKTGRISANADSFVRYGGSAIFLVIILLIIVPLLASSDPAFADVLDRITLGFFDTLDFGRVIRVVFWTLVATVGIGALLLSPARVALREPRSVFSELRPPISYPLILGGIIAVYALYVGVQVRYFFLPADTNVYAALGLTYSEYIHKGFNELLFVSFFNLVLAKAFFELAREGRPAPSALVRSMIALVAVAAMVIAASGCSRAAHYVQTYGLSIERVLVIYASVLAIAVFAIALAKLALPNLREMPIAVGLAILSFLALAYSNVEETVASYNIDHQNQRVNLDEDYILFGLSEDALDEKIALVQRDPGRIVTRPEWRNEKPRTLQTAFFEDWYLPRTRAANGDSREPPAWYRANYSTYRLYSDSRMENLFPDVRERSENADVRDGRDIDTDR